MVAEGDIFCDPFGDCLVAAQIKSLPQGLAKERPKGAKLPEVKEIENLEKMILDGPTPQLRVYAGVLLAMANASGRSSDILRSRDLVVKEDALLAESRMKNSEFWTPWAAVRRGLVLDDWAGAWIKEMAHHQLAGPDFICYGINEAADTWAARPAEFQDVEIAMRILLQLSGKTAEEALEYSPHSLKHFQISCAMQLEIRPETIDDMGHWRPGSAMSRVYNSVPTARELQGRDRVVQALVSGWRPAKDGVVPEKYEEREVAVEFAKLRRFKEDLDELTQEFED